MRIAILVPSLHGGGAEFVAVQWAEYLGSMGDEVTILTTHAPKGSRSVHIRGRWFGERLLSLRGVLKRQRFDIVLSFAPHWNLLAVVSTFAFRGRPTICISGRTIEIEAVRAGNQKRIEITLAKIWYRLADGFIAISHATAAEAQARFGIPVSRIWVVPNPALAKLGEFDGRPASAPASGSTLEIAVPGRLTSSKRPRLALSVAQRCATITRRPVRVHFFGSGAEEEAVRRAVPQDIEVVFHGWVEQWFDEVPPGAVVLLPSRLEGFANVLVESAARGFPSVASSRALGVSDAILPGITGSLALTDSIDDFAEAVLEAEDIELGIAAGAWFRRFTPEASGARLRRALVAVDRERRERSRR